VYVLVSALIRDDLNARRRWSGHPGPCRSCNRWPGCST